MEVYLYAQLTNDETAPRQEIGNTQTPHWIPLGEVPTMAVWPKELKTLAALLAAGQRPRGVPSFVSQMGSPDTPAPQVEFA